MYIFKSINLNKDSETPLYKQLYSKIKKLIYDGILLPDNKLPSVRKLSSILGINRVTVISAYSNLENEGLIYTRQGSGTYVTGKLPNIKKNDIENTGIIRDELYEQEDLSFISNGQIKIDRKTIDFASATPTPELFPVENFKKVLNEVLDRDKGNAFGYHDSQGLLSLRKSVSNLLDQNKIASDENYIQIISGAQQGIDIISKALISQGDYVLTESPTYIGAVSVFKSRKARIIEVEMDNDGPDLNVIEYNLKKYKPKLFYTIPSFQNPTGYSYSNEKRIQLVKLLNKYNTHAIEDAYVSDLDFESRNYKPLKTLDENNRIFYIKSFSKIFMPGLRLGFMLVPKDMQSNILQAKHTTDISTSGLIQRAFALYIDSGYWSKHFDFMYKIYKSRYSVILNSLKNCLPEQVSYSPPGGGLNIWLELPYGFPVNILFKQSIANKIVFAPGRIFYNNLTLQKLNTVRVSFASVYTEQIEQGIATLVSLINSLLLRDGQYRNMPIL